LLLYYITDRTQFPGDEFQRRTRLIEKISEAALAGVDYVQLREKDLPARELERLAREAVQNTRESGSKTRLLINSRTDVALSTQADGVHLRSDDISPVHVRRIWQQDLRQPIVVVSCHTEAEVIAAKNAKVDFLVFGPIFEKKARAGTAAGLDQLRAVCRNQIPVLALGGITPENARACIAAGASGIAAIRLFQDNEIFAIVEKLKAECKDVAR
jgi:thiamine-phosphate pyrophosphorylase